VATEQRSTKHENTQLSTVNRQKVLTFVCKTNEKRVTTFSGLVAKLQQSLDNGEDQFVYFANKKSIAFLTLLRESGVIHNFHIIKRAAQWRELGIYLSPAFDSRILVVYLKTAAKNGPAVQSFKMFTVPSRQVSISYKQLVEKTKSVGPSTLYVLNTPKGLLTHVVALRYKIGGEVVCELK
jgi:ribosomal protein S8